MCAALGGRTTSVTRSPSERESGRAVVLGMKAAEEGRRNDIINERSVARTRQRRVVFEAQVRARGVVVPLDVLAEDLLKLSDPEDQQVVRALPPQRADDPLAVGVLPGRLGAPSAVRECTWT